MLMSIYKQFFHFFSKTINQKKKPSLLNRYICQIYSSIWLLNKAKSMSISFLFFFSQIHIDWNFQQQKKSRCFFLVIIPLLFFLVIRTSSLLCLVLLFFSIIVVLCMCRSLIMTFLLTLQCIVIIMNMRHVFFFFLFVFLFSFKS